MKSLPVLWRANHRFTLACPFLWEMPRGLGELGPWAATLPQWCTGSGLYQAVLPSVDQGWWHKHFTTIFKYDPFVKFVSREDACSDVLWRLWLSVKKSIALTTKMPSIFSIYCLKTFISMKKEWIFTWIKLQKLNCRRQIIWVQDIHASR